MSWAAHPRERAPKAERGAESAAAVPRRGAALFPIRAQLGNVELLRGDRLLEGRFMQRVNLLLSW